MKKKAQLAPASEQIINQSYELVATGALKPHPRNVNRGDLVAIGSSIAENGFYGAIVAQKSTGYILAGNHRFEAALAAGIASVPVTWVGVDNDRALRILLADNRTTRLGHDDQEELAKLLQEILADTETLAGTGFDEAALNQLLAEVGVCPTEGLTDEDAVPPVQEVPITEPGDLWILGDHRLLCGDSTSIDAVERLMDGQKADMVFTDPPYGISIVKQVNGSTKGVGGGPKPYGSEGVVGGGGSAGAMYPYGGIKKGVGGGANIVKPKLYAPVINDESTGTAEAFYHCALASGIKDFIIFGGNYFTSFLPPSACWVIWDKQNSGNFADVEMAWTSFDRGARLYPFMWNGLSRQGDRKTELATRVHPTQKPVGLIEKIFGDFSFQNCFDGFLGSGSTLIACEKTHRSCFGVEMSPDYCDVIVKRWQDFTGKAAHLEDGRAFDELAAQRRPAAA